MPSEQKSNDALLHIEQNILLAKSFVAELSFDEFVADIRTVYATTRCLEIISEAARRLSDDVRDRHSHLPWQQIAAAGNIYRHEYENVIHGLLWHTVHESLDVLMAAVKIELNRTD